MDIKVKHVIFEARKHLFFYTNFDRLVLLLYQGFETGSIEIF
jgi:hypothetical protein